MDNEVILEQKKSVCTIIIWGITYWFLFPLLYEIWIPFFEIDWSSASFKRIFTHLVTVSPIYAMPFSFCLMVLAYWKRYYRLSRLCWILPILLYAFAVLVNGILGQSR